MFNPQKEAIDANIHPRTPVLQRSELIAFMNSLADDLDIMLDHRHKHTTINMGARFITAEKTTSAEAIMIVNTSNAQYVAISNYYPESHNHLNRRPVARVQVQYLTAKERIRKDDTSSTIDAVGTATYLYNKVDDRLKLLADIRDHITGIIVMPSMRISVIAPVLPPKAEVEPNTDDAAKGLQEAITARAKKTPVGRKNLTTLLTGGKNPAAPITKRKVDTKVTPKKK